MWDMANVIESEGKQKALDSESMKQAPVLTPDEEEQIPPIFSCRHPTSAIPADSVHGPSGSAQNVARESCSELLNTKHKIFLSHAGAEKNFVEQLCVDLEAMGYWFPFFDRRSHSLPGGKDFAPLILEAAKQCHVAVIVLSETYLTSKWPMIELGKFFEVKMAGNSCLNFLPLFFKLSMEDLDDRSIDERWMPKWREYALRDERIDVNQWREAVKALPKVNAYIFEQLKAPHKKITGILYRSEVEYRSAVTQAVLELSPPDLLYGSSQTVVGYDRLCETLWSQFVEDSTTGVLLLGLYGMPGLGKTTMSKALCDQFYGEFMNRVCHLELGDSSRALERQKEVLKKLLGIKNDVLKTISDVDQGRTLMRNCLMRDSTKKQSAVFLVIDNVCGDQHWLDEARAYLEAGFCPKSRIMVTSRSLPIAKGLLSDSKFCKPVPDLTVEEAGTIFLKIAAPGRILSLLGVEERRILGLCVEQCRFSRDGSFSIDTQYHPLALRALANYFRNQHSNRKSLLAWEKCLEDVKRGFSPVLFGILELQFDSLNETLQLIFLDIALYAKELVGSIIDGSHPGILGWLTWLAGLHMDTPPASVEDILRQLERSGMIKLPEVTMHQLYKDFAVWLVAKQSSSLNKWCAIESAHSYGRTRIVGLKGSIPRSRVQLEWGTLVLLQLRSCTDVRELSLDGLDCLRHLEVVELKNLETLTLSRENDSLRFVWLSGLDSLKHLPDFRFSCRFVQTIVITRCLNLTGPALRMEGCSELERLHTDLTLFPHTDIDFMTSLRSLSELRLSTLGAGGSGEGDVLNLDCLGLCSRLKFVTLVNLPVKRVLGVAQVTSLYDLIVIDCNCLDEAPEVGPETSVLLEDISGANASFWPVAFAECITDLDRKLKELEDEAVRLGFSGVPKSSLHSKWDDSLGPSLSLPLVYYLADLYHAGEEEEIERLVPGLRTSRQCARGYDEVFVHIVRAIVLHLVNSSTYTILEPPH